VAPRRRPNVIAARTDELAGWQITVRKTIARPPKDVFALLADVERMAGLGPEHCLARWLTESREAGARFKGINRIGVFRWEVLCTVTAFLRPQRFGWTVGDPDEPSSTWTYQLEATNGGAGDATTVTQTFEHGPGDSFVRRAVELAPAAADVVIAGRTRQLRHNMNATLHRVELQLVGTSET
jgi:uncharacterized protein YndB with AHSA1/START domain